MKHSLTCLFVLIFALSGCKNNKNTIPAANGSDTIQAAGAALPDGRQKIEDLQQLSPFTPDQMKELLPATLGGDSASSLDAGSNMGTAFARAVYPLNDSATIELTVFDCGGNAGAGIYQAQFLHQLDNQSGDENEYTKSIDFKKGKAIEHADKKNHISSLVFFDGDRLLVILEGNNVEIVELKKVAGNLNIK